jgi:sulfite reductase (NADPH) flavoprotein alpha-component
MLAGEKLQQFKTFISTSSREEQVWMNGYLSAMIAGEQTATVQQAPKKITIAYGTETGNSKKLATSFAAKAKKAGIRTKLVGLDQYPPGELAAEEYFFTVISTHGEGEPPEAAKNFYEHIHKNGFKIPQLKFGVLALGDTAYPLFCKTGEDVDTQLQQLGANRIVPLQKCDIDYEEQAENWFTEVLQKINTGSTLATPVTIIAPVKKTTGKQKYTGSILSNINLTGRGSTKKTYHIEIATEADYLPGDSIAIVPSNDPLLVEEIISLSGLQPDKTITWRNETITVKELLSQKATIVYLMEKTVQQYTALAETTIPLQRADLAETTIPLQRADLADLLRSFPLKNETAAETLLQQLTPIAPRIYNIASSPAAHEGAVHITALQDIFAVNGVTKHGLCTNYFESKKPGDEISFFVQPNKRFRLPDEDKDIIMIGPGTGIAPFRSFIAERDATGATGRNWLFFAETDFTTDFYYQAEWQTWFNTDVLTKVSLAFNNSSQAAQEIQHKILQQAAALFKWIENGAYVYLCGEKEPMSKNAEAALLTVIAQQGNLAEEAAKQYFENLKTTGRYMKDVY